MYHHNLKTKDYIPVHWFVLVVEFLQLEMTVFLGQKYQKAFPLFLHNLIEKNPMFFSFSNHATENYAFDICIKCIK